MTQLIIRILTNILSIGGIIFSTNWQTISQAWCIGEIILISALIVWLFFELITFVKNMPKKFESPGSEINAYMYKLVNNNQNTAIFTRDLSWAQDIKVKDMLIAKAQKNNLVIYIPSNNAISDELQAAGAKIYTYASCGYTPKSRFTIVNFGTAHPHIAVTEYGKNTLLVREYTTSNNDPVQYVISDLLSILERANSRVPNF